jgi:glycine/D-amino acid oxidase-like deaminating enzyme
MHRERDSTSTSGPGPRSEPDAGSGSGSESDPESRSPSGVGTADPDRTARPDRVERAGAGSAVETAPRSVAVVGGGAVGLHAAVDLADAGIDVTVYERGAPGDPETAGSSPRAAGVCYDAYAGDVDARVAARAMARFRDADALEECPYAMLAREGDERTADALAANVDRMRARDRPVRRLDADDLAAAFPGVRTDDVAVAAVTENAGWADPAAYVRDLADEARAAGVDLRTGEAVGVSTDPPGVVVDAATERYDAVAVAAGAHTKRLLADAGVAVPLKPYRVQALVADAAGYDAPMLFDATSEVYCRPHPEGLLAGDGTVPREADPDGYERAGDPGFESEALADVRRRLPDVEPTLARSWAGLCVATPDGDPLLGAVRPGTFVAAGWQGHGFMRAPATGELLAEAVRGGDPPAPFDPARVDGDEAFEIVQGMSVEPDDE